MTATTFPQVSAICGTSKTDLQNGIENRKNLSGAYRCDLQKYAAQLQAKPTPTRLRRHRLEGAMERRGKLIAETGFDTAGIMCEPPDEQWTRPEAQTLYHKLMVRDPGKPNIRDYEGTDLRHLMWLLDAELIDIAEDGSIWPLSDCEPPSRKYPGAPVSDERARIGRTHTAEEAEGLVLEVWQAIVAGNPIMDIPAEYRAEMTTSKGVRISGRLITRHVNRLLGARFDAECNCLGRDQVTYAWELLDHGENCPGVQRWFHVDVIQRAICRLVKAMVLQRTDGAHLGRKGHTEWRIPCAYAIPADAGWRKYADVPARRKRKPWSVLRSRLLGGDREPAAPSAYVTAVEDTPSGWPADSIGAAA